MNFMNYDTLNKDFAPTGNKENTESPLVQCKIQDKRMRLKCPIIWRGGEVEWWRGGGVKRSSKRLSVLEWTSAPSINIQAVVERHCTLWK